MAIVQDPETGEWYDNGSGDGDNSSWMTAQINDIQSAWERGDYGSGEAGSQAAMDAIRQLNIADSYDPDIAGSSWDAYINDIAGAGNIDPGQLVSSALSHTASTGGGATSTVMAAINRALGLGGPSGTGEGALTGREVGVGTTGVMGLLAALSAKPSTSTQSGTVGQTGSTSSTTGGPDWYKNLTKDLGTAISGENGSWSDLSGYITGGAEGVAGADLSEYMNPYVNNVLNPQLMRMTEDFTRGENSRRAKAGMMGAFGGSRDILEGSLATERFNKATSEATNTALSQAYTSAMDAFGKDRSAQQWGAGVLGNLYAGLKPETTTAGSTGTTQTTGATITGSDPNTFGQLTNLAGSLTQLAKP